MSYRQLYQGEPAASSAAVYTSTNTCTTITAFSVVNTTGSAVTLDAWIVESGGSVADSKRILNGYSVAANEAGAGIEAPTVQTMPKNSELHLQASSGSALTVTISGDLHE